MENHVFDSFLEHCQEFPEASTGIEIFNYTDPAYNSFEEYDIFSENISDFLHRREAFRPPVPLNNSIKCIGGLRLIIQANEANRDTPTNRAVFLPKASYREMFDAFHLNKRSVDAGSIEGPSFWAAEDGTDDDPYLTLVHHQSFEGDHGEPHSWELVLSYSFQTKLTCGYLRACPKSSLAEAARHIKTCPHQMLHPLSLPVFFASYEFSPHKTQTYYEARKCLELLEYNVAHCREADPDDDVILHAVTCGVDDLVQDMAECYKNTISSNPQEYGPVLEGIEEALDTFWDVWSIFDVNETADKESSSREAIEKIHRKLVSTIHFYAMRLEQLEGFVAATQSRLQFQRKMIKTIISQQNAKLVEQVIGTQHTQGLVDHTWKRAKGTRLPALFGPSYLPVFLLLGCISFGVLVMRLANSLWIQLKSVHIRSGNEEGNSPSLRPIDILVYVLSLTPMAVFITLLYKSGKRKAASKELGLVKTQESGKEEPLALNGKPQ